MTDAEIVGQNFLLDAAIAKAGVKNDAAMARLLKLAPPVLSKVRNGKMPVGCSMILKMHETLDMPVAHIRALLAGAV